jgi:outer membrane protein
VFFLKLEHRLTELKSLRSLLIIFFAFLFSAAGRAGDVSVTKEKPLYEFGVGTGGGYLQDYPAAEQSHFHMLALPVVRYRGEYLRADEEDGVRAEIFKDKNYEFNLSFNGSFPADSSNNRMRQGMPDLDWIGEVGPRFNYYFIREPDDIRFRIGLPLRGLFATDLQRVHQVGYNFAPEIEYEKYHSLCEICRWSVSLTANIVSQQVADYFYEVKNIYATPSRAAFAAKVGYLGSNLDMHMSVEWLQATVGLGATYSNYKGSVNADSPLYGRAEALEVYFGLNWFFNRSKAIEFDRTKDEL